MSPPRNFPVNLPPRNGPPARPPPVSPRHQARARARGLTLPPPRPQHAQFALQRPTTPGGGVGGGGGGGGNVINVGDDAKVIDALGVQLNTDLFGCSNESRIDDFMLWAPRVEAVLSYDWEGCAQLLRADWLVGLVGVLSPVAENAAFINSAIGVAKVVAEAAKTVMLNNRVCNHLSLRVSSLTPTLTKLQKNLNKRLFEEVLLLPWSQARPLLEQMAKQRRLGTGPADHQAAGGAAGGGGGGGGGSGGSGGGGGGDGGGGGGGGGTANNNALSKPLSTAAAMVALTSTDTPFSALTSYIAEIEAPLKLMVKAFEKIDEQIDKWRQKGKVLFGCLRQALKATDYAARFAELSSFLDDAIESFQTAVQSETLIKVMQMHDMMTEAQKESRQKREAEERAAAAAAAAAEAPNKATNQREIVQAAEADKSALPEKIGSLDDPELKLVLRDHRDEMRTLLQDTTGRLDKILLSLDGVQAAVIEHIDLARLEYLAVVKCEKARAFWHRHFPFAPHVRFTDFKLAFLEETMCGELSCEPYKELKEAHFDAVMDKLGRVFDRDHDGSITLKEYHFATAVDNPDIEPIGYFKDMYNKAELEQFERECDKDTVPSRYTEMLGTVCVDNPTLSASVSRTIARTMISDSVRDIRASELKLEGEFSDDVTMLPARWLRQSVAVRKLSAPADNDDCEWGELLQRVAAVDHENLECVFGLVDDDNLLAVVVERAEPTLYDYLVAVRTGGKAVLTNAHCMCMARQIASGVMELHAADIMHRDLRARNVLIGEVGNQRRCRVAGVLLGDGAAHTRETAPAWVAPECAVTLPRIAKYIASADVFALGVLLFEIASLGEQPMAAHGDSRSAVAGAYNNGERPSLGGSAPLPPNAPTVGDAYKRLMQSCWRTSAGNRPSLTNLLTTIETYGCAVADDLHALPTPADELAAGAVRVVDANEPHTIELKNDLEQLCDVKLETKRLQLADLERAWRELVKPPAHLTIEGFADLFDRDDETIARAPFEKMLAQFSPFVVNEVVLNDSLGSASDNQQQQQQRQQQQQQQQQQPQQQVQQGGEQQKSPEKLEFKYSPVSFRQVATLAAQAQAAAAQQQNTVQHFPFVVLHPSTTFCGYSARGVAELLSARYFHGFLSGGATAQLLNGEPPGTFLFRFSSQQSARAPRVPPHPLFSLGVVNAKGAVEHVQVSMLKHAPYAMSVSRTTEDCGFLSLTELIEWHSTHAMINLSDEVIGLLQYAAPRAARA